MATVAWTIGKARLIGVDQQIDRARLIDMVADMFNGIFEVFQT